MVFPNFFITFVRHSFHTSHPCTSPSRERRHRPAPHLPPGTTLPSWHMRCLTRHAHALHIAKGYAHAPRTRHASSSLTAHTPPPHYNPRKGLCHTRCSPSQHTRPPRYTPRKGLCHAHASRAKMPQCFPLQPPPF